MRSALTSHWYRNGWLSWLLRPLSWAYCLVVTLRRVLYRAGLLRSYRLSVPVIVIGNLTVGGTGKTPLVIWLCERLRAAGFRPGVVARGYGGRAARWPQMVTADSDPLTVGDEPVLIAQRSGCPMAVGPDRVAAARAVLARHDCDVIVSDDGLQHYRLARDVEIAVLDGERRYGNGLCLPAGPLREPRARGRQVDLQIVQGEARDGELGMTLETVGVYNLVDGRRGALRDFRRGAPVHAVAGIGHPARFFRMLGDAGLQCEQHPFPDHHAFRPEDLRFPGRGPVIMTEKDGVKCRGFADPRLWAVAVEARIDPRAAETVIARLAAVGRARQ